MKRQRKRARNKATSPTCHIDRVISRPAAPRSQNEPDSGGGEGTGPTGAGTRTGCWAAVGYGVLVKGLAGCRAQRWPPSARGERENELCRFCRFASLIKKKVSCSRINSQTLIYYIHLCHLHISIRPFITKHYTLSTAGGLYMDSKFLQIRQ